MIIAVSVYTVIVALIIGIPFYRTFVAPWRRAILQVADVTFTMRDFVKQLRLKMPPSETNKLTAATKVLQEMQHTELIRQEAVKRNLTVSEEEVDQEIRQRVKASTTGEGNFEDLYAAMLRGLGLKADEYRDWIRSDVLQMKLFQSFIEKMPRFAEHIHLYAIVTDSAKKAETLRNRVQKGEDFKALAGETSIDLESAKKGGEMGWMPKDVDELTTPGQIRAWGILARTEEEAKDLKEKILKGDDFAELARYNSLDDETRDKGGDLGWLPLEEGSGKPYAFDAYELDPDQLSAPIEGYGGFWIIKLIEKTPIGKVIDDVAFNLPVGRVSPPINTIKGVYLVMVEAKEPRRPLSDEHRVILARKSFEKWVNQVSMKGTEEGWIKWDWGSETYNWVVDHLNSP